MAHVYIRNDPLPTIVYGLCMHARETILYHTDLQLHSATGMWSKTFITSIKNNFKNCKASRDDDTKKYTNKDIYM